MRTKKAVKKMKKILHRVTNFRVFPHNSSSHIGRETRPQMMNFCIVRFSISRRYIILSPRSFHVLVGFSNFPRFYVGYGTERIFHSHLGQSLGRVNV